MSYKRVYLSKISYSDVILANNDTMVGNEEDLLMLYLDWYESLVGTIIDVFCVTKKGWIPIDIDKDKNSEIIYLIYDRIILPQDCQDLETYRDKQIDQILK